MNENNGKYFFIPNWLLQENSQTIHAYIYILNEINNNGGEFKTSSIQIAKDLKISRQQARLILNKITSIEPTTNQQITNKPTNKNTVLSVNFNSVKEDVKNATRTQPQQPTRQPTNTFDFRKKLIEYGFKENIVDDWLKVRKTKKATNTETAFNSFIKEIESRTCDINEMLEIAATNSWSGFKHIWIDNLKKHSQNGTAQPEQQFKTVSNAFAERIAEGLQSDKLPKTHS